MALEGQPLSFGLHLASVNGRRLEIGAELQARRVSENGTRFVWYGRGTGVAAMGGALISSGKDGYIGDEMRKRIGCPKWFLKACGVSENGTRFVWNGGRVGVADRECGLIDEGKVGVGLWVRRAL